MGGEPRKSKIDEISTFLTDFWSAKKKLHVPTRIVTSPGPENMIFDYFCTNNQFFGPRLGAPTKDPDLAGLDRPLGRPKVKIISRFYLKNNDLS